MSAVDKSALTCYKCSGSGHFARECKEEGSSPSGFRGRGGGRGRGGRGRGRGGNTGSARSEKCYKCNQFGHIAKTCSEPERCYKCNQTGHQARDCSNADDSCYNCGNSGHFARDCPEAPKEREERTDLTCYNCGEAGHFSRDCTVAKENGHGDDNEGFEQPRRRVKQFDSGRGGGRQFNRGPKCYNCNGFGHMARDCESEASERYERNENGPSKMICYRCGKNGHRAKDCETDEGPLCYNCQKCGHIAVDCPEA